MKVTVGIAAFKDYPRMHEARYNIMVDLAKGGKKLLDLGDINSSPLAKKLKKLFQTTTLDIRNGADIKCNLEKGLKLKQKFDVVIAGELLEHIYHLRFLLNDLKKILTKDGKLIISVPNVCNLKSRIKVLIGKLPTYCADADEYDRDIGGHIRDLNLSYMKRILREEGYEILKIKSGGLWYNNKLIIPPRLCKPSFGDNIILSAKVLRK